MERKCAVGCCGRGDPSAEGDPSPRMPRIRSAGSMQKLAPLELGAKMERAAYLHAKTSHILGRAVLLAMIYLVALEIFPVAMEPGGKLWSLLLLWCVSYHAGEGFERAGAPKALGMLVSGLILRSLPHGNHLAYPLDHLVTWWSKDIRAGAMALVLLRAGLGMDLSNVLAYGWSLPLMATLPSLIESVIGAAFATYLFGMPFLLAWVMSFMVSAVGPAIIASGCAAVKEKGYVTRAPNFLMTTAVFDDTTCIIGFNCLLHAWIPGEGDVGWQYAIGPMNLVLGVFGGVVAALAMSATSLYPGPGPRTWTLFAMCMMLIFVAEKHELLGAGAIANLVFGLGVRNLWKRGWPHRFLDPEHAAGPDAVATQYLKESLGGLYKVWNISFYPLLFGLIGASLDVRVADPTIGRLAVGYSFFTIAIRFFATLLVVHLPAFRAFTTRERIFMAVAWISKATTQAAFATVPLLELQAWVTAHPGESWKGNTPAQLLLYGKYIQWTCVISIFTGTPLGTVLMVNGAQWLLEKIPGPDAGTGASAVVEINEEPIGDPQDDDPPGANGVAPGGSEAH